MIFYRLQPKGLSVIGHRSETSTGRRARGIHVFTNVWETFAPDAGRNAYGDEVLVLYCADSECCVDNEDVEGVEVDPADLVVLGRYSYSQWDALICEIAGEAVTHNKHELADLASENEEEITSFFEDLATQ